jgi:hypothetical protein
LQLPPAVGHSNIALPLRPTSQSLPRTDDGSDVLPEVMPAATRGSACDFSVRNVPHWQSSVLR